MQRGALLRILQRQIIWVTFTAGCNAASALAAAIVFIIAKTPTLTARLLFIHSMSPQNLSLFYNNNLAIGQRFLDHNESRDTSTEATVLHLKSGV